MHNRMNRVALLTSSAAAAILLASGSVLAQDRPRPNPSDTLRGPSVNDRAMPREERFGDSMMQDRRQSGDFATYRLMVAGIADLSDHENEALRLTAEQGEKIAQIQSAYQKALREYMAEAREQTQNLRERVRRAREQAGGDPEEMRQLMERARARAAEIRKNAPQPERAEAAMWEVLTPPQRRTVNASIEERREEMLRDRQMQRERRATDAVRPDDRRRDAPQRPARRGTQTDFGPDARPDAPMRPEAVERRPGGPETDRPGVRRTDRPLDRPTDRADADMRRWGQLFQRIQRLTPQQQDRLFNMISQTLDRAQRSADGPPADRPIGPNADRPGRRGPDADRDAPRPSDQRRDRPRRGERPDVARD